MASATTSTGSGGRESTRRNDITNLTLLRTVRGQDHTITDELLKQVLEKNSMRFVNTVGTYLPKNSESRKKILSGKATWRDKELTIEKQSQEFVLRFSDFMDLDEVQAFSVLQGYLRTEKKGSVFSFNDEEFKHLCEWFYEERVTLINCVAEMLRRGSLSVHSQFRFHSLLTFITAESMDLYQTFVQGLLVGKKLPEAILKQYTTLCDKEVPRHLSREDSEEWVVRNAKEQYALLEVLFLIYYLPATSTPEKLAELIRIFKERHFGTKQRNATFITNHSREIYRKIGYLTVLIIIECMGLENLLMENMDSSASDLFNTSIFLDLDREISQWKPAEHLGPILLAWAAVTHRAKDGEPPSSDDACQWQIYAMRAVESNAIQYLQTMLSDGIEQNDENRSGYKSILKGLLQLMMLGFEMSSWPDFPGVVRLHNLIFEDQPQLCGMFWKTDYNRPELRSVLEIAKANFPLDFRSLTTMMVSLIADETDASTAFAYLESLDSYKTIMEISQLQAFAEEIMHDGQGALFRCRTSGLQVDGVLDIPVNTIGEVVAVKDDQAIVVWRLEYSAFALFMMLMESYSESLVRSGSAPSAQLEKVTMVVQLLARMFEHGGKENLGEAVEQTINKHIKATTTPYATRGNKFSLLRCFFVLLQHCSFDREPSLQLISAIISAINCLAETQSLEAWVCLRTHGIVGGVDDRVQGPAGAMKHVLSTVECVRGLYPVTLKFLDLLSTLVNKLQGWHHYGGGARVSPDEFLPCLSYLQTAIFSFYETWRYKNLLDRWKIGSKVLHIFLDILNDSPEKGSTLQGRLHYAILSEGSVYLNLLNIIGVGRNAFQYHWRIKENGGVLEDLVNTAFMVLDRALSMKFLKTSSASPLEVALLSRSVGKDSLNLVHCIASYIGLYQRETPRLATRLLTKLCLISGDDHTRPPSLIGYFGGSAEQLRGEFLWKLGNTRESVPLRIAILELITASLEWQQGLAEMLINVHPDAPSEESKKRPQREFDDEYWVTHSLKVVLAFVHNPKFLKTPRLVAEAWRLLAAIWRSGLKYQFIIAEITKLHPGFWNSMIVWTELPTLLIDEYEAESSAAYIFQCRAYMFEILAMEVFHSTASTRLEHLQNVFNKLEADSLKWCSRFMVCSYEPKTVEDAEKKAKALGISLGVHVLPNERVYGNNYFHDVYVHGKKLFNAMPPYPNLDSENIRSFTLSVNRLNSEMALIKAQLNATRAWVEFVRVVVSRQPSANIVGSTIDRLSGLIAETTKIIANENREGPPIIQFYVELSSLILLLVRQWTKALQAAEASSIVALSATSRSIVSYIRNALTRVRSTSDTSTSLILKLLSSVLIVLNNASDWDTKLKTDALTFIPDAIECLEVPELADVSLSLIEIIGQNLGEESALTLNPLLAERGAIPKLLAAMHELLGSRADPKRAEILVHVILALSQSNSAMVEQMAIAGIVRLFCNESWTAFVRYELANYTDKDERNPWHRVWCMILSVLLRMLKSLANAENFVAQVLEFVMIHQHRFARALDVSNQSLMANGRFADGSSTPGEVLGLGSSKDKSDRVLTLASLEETERSMALIYQLGHHRRRWSYILDSPYSDNSLASAIDAAVLRLLLQAALTVKDSSNVLSAAKPVTPQERKMAVFDKKASVKPEEINELIPFVQEVEKALYRILQDAVAFTRLLTPMVFGDAASVDPDVMKPLFESSMDRAVRGMPTLGLLFDLFAGAQKKAVKLGALLQQKMKSSSIQVQQVNATEMLPVLMFIIEGLVFIILSHVTIYMAPHLPEVVRRRAKDEIGLELDTYFNTLAKDLERIYGADVMTKDASKKKEFFEKAKAFLKKLRNVVW